MTELRDAKQTETSNTFQPEFKISVKNFGPIENGSVALRPLTVFVGPSNTGKTYLAILIYALRRILGGFTRLPVIHPTKYHSIELDRRSDHSERDADTLEENVHEVLVKLLDDDRPFSFSDLPDRVREIAEGKINDSGSLGGVLEAELQRCFDLDSVVELIGPSSHEEMSLSLQGNENGKDLWRIRMDVSETNVATSGRIEDIVLLPSGWTDERSDYHSVLSEFDELSGGPWGVEAHLDIQHPIDILEQLVHPYRLGWRDRTHYLPAARSGIMQSHRVIASSLVERSTRAGLARFPELPTFSGVMVDFLRRLILFKETVGREDLMTNLADALERDALAGNIRTTESQGGGYPEFVYRPRESQADIRLTRASSMVTELAPIVLFLRGIISRGDMLIIEEPEAHLHPAAQTIMAGVLARLVREGVRVVVTTHSDWMLKEIGNLIREGELEEDINSLSARRSPSSSLRPNEVGVWLFRKGETSTGSTIEEIPFDRSEGVEPGEYEDVAEALYNRSATLQNRLEELAEDAESEQQ